MNATNRPVARLADLSPFYLTVATQEQLPRVHNAVYRECCPARAASDSDYGCVDWYQYRVVEQLQPEQQRARG
jgi:hypothetical protein